MPILRVVAAIWPFYFVLIGVLLIVTYVPVVSLGLRDLLY